jgi:hypothetical protein
VRRETGKDGHIDGQRNMGITDMQIFLP